MTYQTPPGGHAPTDLREAFELAIEDLTVTDEDDLDEPLGELVARIWHLSGQLWNCTDTTSREFAALFDYLDYYQPRREDVSPSQIVGSFGRASRFIRGLIRHDPNLSPFIPSQKDALQEIANRAAMRFHIRKERSNDDRRDILGRAYAELAVAMPEAGTVELAFARNNMAAAFALALNGLYASGVPGGANGPATLFPVDA